MTSICDRLKEIRARMCAAALRVGRDPLAVRLCAVSKTFPAEAVAEAVAAGQVLFGENRVQECVEKIPRCGGGLEWHLIGHLQSNKVRKVVPLVNCVQGVDSVELLRGIDRVAGELGRRMGVLLQVNVAADGAKAGFSVEETEGALVVGLGLEHVEVRGLMTIPSLCEAPEEARPHFAALRVLRDALVLRCGVPLGELSMGMSGDYEVAVEEGATLVRVGSAIFGGR